MYSYVMHECLCFTYMYADQLYALREQFSLSGSCVKSILVVNSFISSIKVESYLVHVHVHL